MIIGFIIWTVITVLFIGIGCKCLHAKAPVGFFIGAEPPKVKDVTQYNHAVAKIWFVFAGLFELFGVPMLFLQQNSPLFLLAMLGVPLLVIGIMVSYFTVTNKYREKST